MAEVYVDPSIDADSGAGTIGDPYGDFAWALTQHTHVAGDRYNVKEGTAENVVASLALPTDAIVQGYIATAGDGGVAEFSANGASVTIFDSTGIDDWSFLDCHFHDTTSAILLRGDNNLRFINCEFNNCPTSAVVGDAYLTFENCHFHDIGGRAIAINVGSIRNCYFANGVKGFTVCIGCDANWGVNIERNIFSFGSASASDAIHYNRECRIHNNSFLSPGGTGKAITPETDAEVAEITGNLLEGFDGVGGLGIDLPVASELLLYGNNGLRSTTNSLLGSIWRDVGDNEVLGATPFKKSGADSYANRFDYYAPADIGNVHGGAFPSGSRIDKGAVQHVDPAGGGGSFVARQKKIKTF